MKKQTTRVLYIFLAAIMLVTTCTFAQETPYVEVSGTVAAGDTSELTAAELLEGYLYTVHGLYPDSAGGIAVYAAPMTPEVQEIYDLLVPEIKSIACGDRDSSEIELTGYAKTFTWRKSELGITGNIIYEGALTEEASEKLKVKIRETIDDETLLQNLLTQMPYEMYWFDKVTGMKYSTGKMPINVDLNSEDPLLEVTIDQLAFDFAVSEDYAVTEGNTYYLYQPDTARTSAAARAAGNAMAVVRSSTGKNDSEKLAAYRDYITAAVSYDHEAAATNNDYYGAPWQIINVFDGDDSTNVVCEGYSKAFKYLCDLTWAGDGAVQCYLATGEMVGGTGAGAHMWNIVSIGGANYLADVTNCDAETIGVPDKLFLCGVSGDAESGYTAVVGNDKIIYTYDDETKLVYDTELVLSSEAYMPGVYSTEQLTALARYVAGITDVEPQGADVNGDGFVSAADLTELARKLTA